MFKISKLKRFTSLCSNFLPSNQILCAKNLPKKLSSRRTNKQTIPRNPCLLRTHNCKFLIATANQKFKSKTNMQSRTSEAIGVQKRWHSDIPGSTAESAHKLSNVFEEEEDSQSSKRPWTPPNHGIHMNSRWIVGHINFLIQV
jgi:hypothetical protein